MDPYQFVSAKELKDGQKIKFPGKKSWWIVTGRKDGYTIVKRGNSTKRISKDSMVLQEPFRNVF